METIDSGNGGIYRSGNGIWNAVGGEGIRRDLGDRHERVYLCGIDAVCGDRSDNWRRVSDLGGTYDADGECETFILWNFHGGAV